MNQPRWSQVFVHKFRMLIYLLMHGWTATLSRCHKNGIHFVIKDLIWVFDLQRRNDDKNNTRPENKKSYYDTIMHILLLILILILIHIQMYTFRGLHHFLDEPSQPNGLKLFTKLFPLLVSFRPISDVLL